MVLNMANWSMVNAHGIGVGTDGHSDNTAPPNPWHGLGKMLRASEVILYLEILGYFSKYSFFFYVSVAIPYLSRIDYIAVAL